MKAASRGIRLEGFPFPELAYILRVDGEVHEFGFSGAGYLDVDKGGEYISVDIGITLEDRGHIQDRITSAILSGVELIETETRERSLNVDLETLRRCLVELTDRYKDELANRNMNKP